MANLGALAVGLTAAGLVIGIALASIMGLFRKNHMPVEGMTVLITGASEGMGRAVARQLAEMGANVIIVSRNVGRLEEALAEIKAAAKSPSQRFHSISADVSAPGYGADLAASATAWNGGRAPDIVWCVAGVSTPQLWAEEGALAACRRNMDVNFWGAAELSHAVLRQWLRPDAPAASRPRHLVFTASVIALFTIVGYGPYSPSKWAVRGLADTLAQEVLLYPDNPVRVHVVYPGTILSPGLDRENRTKPDITLQLEKDDPQQTPRQVAAAAIRGLQAGKHFITVSWLGELMRWGVMGGSIRNSWLVDALGAWFVSLVWFFVLWWMHGDIKAYAKKHGHPARYPKKV